MSSWARVGVKCVCVYADHSFGDMGLVKGRIYTIAEIDTVSAYNAVGEYVHQVAFRLQGVKKKGPWAITDFFDADRFRPLQTISQADDVAMFKELVEGMGSLERLDVLGELLDTTNGV